MTRPQLAIFWSVYSFAEGALFSSFPGHSELNHANFKRHIFPAFQEFPPETRHVWQVEAWLLRDVNRSTPTKHLACFPPQSCPSRVEVPQRLWRPRLWQDVATSNRFQNVRLKFFFRFFASHTQQLAESTSTPASLSYCSSKAHCSAVRCRALPRAVPCCAVLCRALLRFLFRTYQTTTLASIQSWREPPCPRAFYTAAVVVSVEPSFFFFFYGLLF